MMMDEVVQEEQKIEGIIAQAEQQLDPQNVLYQAELNDIDDYPRHLS